MPILVLPAQRKAHGEKKKNVKTTSGTTKQEKKVTGEGKGFKHAKRRTRRGSR